MYPIRNITNIYLLIPDKQSTGTYSFLSCCQKVTNTNIDADVVFCGDNNTTIFKRDDNGKFE